MPDRFSFRALPIATGRVVPSEKAPETRDESNELEALINGDFSTVAQIHPRLRFQAIGSCPVPLRASVMRVVLFKLLGTGVFAGLVAAGKMTRSQRVKFGGHLSCFDEEDEECARGVL